MVRLTLLLLLGYSTWLVHGQASVCPGVSGQPGCVCQHPDGVIDLTKIANNGGSPRFTGLQDPNDYSYDFNPCYKYSAVQCSNVYICQIPNSDPSTSYDIADDNEQIIIDPSDTRGHVYLHYTGPGSGGSPPRDTKVYLHCDQSKTTPTASTDGDSQVILNYVFDVYSCAACPGGCEGGGNTDTPGTGTGTPEGGGVEIFDLYSCHACCNMTTPTTIPAACIHPSLSTNPSLLLALAIFGAGAAVTAMVLLVMVIVLTCKLRKKSQYHMVASQSQ